MLYWIQGKPENMKLPYSRMSICNTIHTGRMGSFLFLGILCTSERLVFHEDSESVVCSDWLCFHFTCFRIQRKPNNRELASLCQLICNIIHVSRESLVPYYRVFSVVVYHVYFIHIYNDVLYTIQRKPENRKLPHPASVYYFTFIIWTGGRRVVSYFWVFPVLHIS